MTKIISLLNFKGGVGKTTTAVNLAKAFHNLGKRVLVVDADAQGKSITIGMVICAAQQEPQSIWGEFVGSDRMKGRRHGKGFSVFLHFLGMGRQLRDGSLRQAETDAETEYKE